MAQSLPHARPVAPTQPEVGVAVPQRPGLELSVYGASDIGRTRRRNEDQFVVATLTGTLWIEQSSIPQERVKCGRERGHLMVVADGMGGHAGGDQASTIAALAVEDVVLSALGWLFRLDEPESRVLEELREALRRADATVSARAAENPEMRAMGTTLTLAYSVDDILYVAHAGDSRCYILRNSDLHQITRDHTLARELVEAGVIRPADIEHNQFRHVVTNVVGGGTTGIAAEVHKVELLAGDTVLLCTDGLTNVVKEDRIIDTLMRAATTEVACLELVQLANDAGGPDNITAIVGRYNASGVASTPPPPL